jgi:hypothetical protein
MYALRRVVFTKNRVHPLLKAARSRQELGHSLIGKKAGGQWQHGFPNTDACGPFWYWDQGHQE